MRGPSDTGRGGACCTLRLRNERTRCELCGFLPRGGFSAQLLEEKRSFRQNKITDLDSSMGTMALDGCGYFCKYVLFIFNLIFAVVGLAFLVLGLWLRYSENTRGIFQIGALNLSAFVIIVMVLIILGSVMLIMVMFGDYGSCSENTFALQVYSTLVSILAAAEIVVGVLSWSQREKIGLSMAEFYTSLYALYVNSGGDPAMGVTLMFIQRTLHCCGVTGMSIIELVQNTCPKPDGFFEYIKMDSCSVVIATIFDSKATLVMWLFIGTGVLLISAMICSLILLKQLKRVQQDITAYYTSVY